MCCDVQVQTTLCTARWTSLGYVLAALLCMISGLPDVLHVFCCAAQVDKQPQPNANPWAFLYFFSFVLCFTYVLMNMFVGVVIRMYCDVRKAEKSEESVTSILRRSQSRWESAMRLLGLVQTPAPPPRTTQVVACTSRGREKMQRILQSRRFEWSIMSVIVANTLVLSMEHYGQSDSWTTALSTPCIHSLSVFLSTSYVSC